MHVWLGPAVRGLVLPASSSRLCRVRDHVNVNVNVNNLLAMWLGPAALVWQHTTVDVLLHSLDINRSPMWVCRSACPKPPHMHAYMVHCTHASLHDVDQLGFTIA